MTEMRPQRRQRPRSSLQHSEDSTTNQRLPPPRHTPRKTDQRIQTGIRQPHNSGRESPRPRPRETGPATRRERGGHPPQVPRGAATSGIAWAWVSNEPFADGGWQKPANAWAVNPRGGCRQTGGRQSDALSGKAVSGG
jgi:hypothetical protein